MLKARSKAKPKAERRPRPSLFQDPFADVGSALPPVMRGVAQGIAARSMPDPSAVPPAPTSSVQPFDPFLVADARESWAPSEPDELAPAEQPAERTEPVSAHVSAELEGPTTFLDELIASIDMEAEQALGPSALADRVPPPPALEVGTEQHIIFGLGGTDYAVHIDNVSEIGEPLEPTPVPNVPDWVLGVANLRGDIISVVDMRAFLGMEPTGYGQRRRMLVAHARARELTAGLIVDRVLGIRRLDVGRIREPAASMDDQVAPYLRGVYQDQGSLMAVLDFDRLLLSPRMSQS